MQRVLSDPRQELQRRDWDLWKLNRFLSRLGTLPAGDETLHPEERAGEEAGADWVCPPTRIVPLSCLLLAGGEGWGGCA